MARQCIFCGGSPVTKEHILARWIGRFAPPGKPAFIIASQAVQPDGFTLSQRRESNALDVTCKKVCKRCNNGWMSKLEATAQPLLTSMIRGSQTTLTVDDQTLLAKWAIKTATMFEYLRPRPAGVPRDLVGWLSTGEGVPPDIWVWLAARGPFGSFVEAEHQTLTSRSPSGAVYDKHGALFTLVIGYFVLQTLVPPGGLEQGIYFPEPSRAFLLPIWPLGSLNRLWPPPSVLDQEGLAEFGKNLITAR